MPATAREVGAVLGYHPDAFWLPEVSIHAAAYYMAKQHRVWKAERPLLDRTKLAQASYNAGAGHILKAQKRCGGPRLYDEIIPCLPYITGKHSKETITYVDRIVYRWYPAILLD